MPFDTFVRIWGWGDEEYGKGWLADHVRMLRLARASRLLNIV